MHRGRGPLSLACAAELRQLGLQVQVIDKRALPGGLNTYGVAEYKLRTADSLREIEMIRGLGVEFEVRDVDASELAQLESEFDAVFLGAGTRWRCTQISPMEGSGSRPPRCWTRWSSSQDIRPANG